MTLFTEAELKERGGLEATRMRRTASSILKEEASVSGVDSKSFDVFLSHSFKDAEIILGVRTVLVALGASVYVDWIEDPKLDRTKVDVDTADLLRKRMRQSKSLIYAHSSNSPSSKWMSWELGYFDGYKGAVAILPIVVTSSESFKGQEFLGLYPYIDRSSNEIWVNRGNVSKSMIGASEYDFVTLRQWLQKRVRVAS